MHYYLILFLKLPFILLIEKLKWYLKLGRMHSFKRNLYIVYQSGAKRFICMPFFHAQVWCYYVTE